MNDEFDDETFAPPQERGLEPRLSESVLMRALSGESLDNAIPLVAIYCGTQGRAQLAGALAGRFPSAHVMCNILDLYQADQTRQQNKATDNLTILCQSDLPDQGGTQFDLVVLPFQSTGDAELTRDNLQTGYERLRDGGQMWVSTNNPRDHWLNDEFRKLFSKVTTRRFGDGIVYSASKTGPLKKRKNFDCEFAFRDGERLIRVVSRPGVFSHRHIDLGARALIETMIVRPGDRVLDLGCGAGVVSLAAAWRTMDGHVLAIDSNPRAVECTRASALLNGFMNVQVAHNADAHCDQSGNFDLVVGNPPYFSHHRISEIFLRGAEIALKPGGTVLIVTKDAKWYCEVMPSRFDAVVVHEHRGYLLVQGTFRGGNRTLA